MKTIYKVGKWGSFLTLRLLSVSTEPQKTEFLDNFSLKKTYRTVLCCEINSPHLFS